MNTPDPYQEIISELKPHVIGIKSSLNRTNQESYLGPKYQNDSVDTEINDRLDTAFDAYVSFFNNLRELYGDTEITKKRNLRDASPEFFEFIEILFPDIHQHPSLKPFIDYADTKQLGEEVELPRDERISLSHTLTHLFSRVIREAENIEYDDDEPTITRDVKERLAMFSRVHAFTSERG